MFRITLGDESCLNYFHFKLGMPFSCSGGMCGEESSYGEKEAGTGHILVGLMGENSWRDLEPQLLFGRAAGDEFRKHNGRRSSQAGYGFHLCKKYCSRLQQ